MNIREQLKTIIESSPGYDVITSKVEPFSDEQAISVEYMSSNFTLFGQTRYKVETTVLITVAIAVTVDYDIILDTVVDYIKAVIFTDHTFMGQFASLPNMVVKYGYKSDGDTNSAMAGIELTFNYDEEFVPDVNVLLNSLNVKTDFIAPVSDKNLFVSNPQDWLQKPDGRIELEFTQDLT